MRIQDINHVSPKIYGSLEMEGLQLPPIFSQGTDITLDVRITDEDNIVEPSDYELTVVLKTTTFATCVLWTGEINNGLYYKGNSMYSILIPSTENASWKAGTYWVDIVATQHTDGLKDVRKVLHTFPLMLVYSTSSPNPGRAISGIPDERTYPLGPNAISG